MNMLPIKFLNEAVRAADRLYPNANEGNIFEFYGPQELMVINKFTDDIPETGQMPPKYMLKLVRGQWNLLT